MLNIDEEEKEVEESKDVVLQYFRVKVAEVLDTAEKFADAKNFKEGQKVLDEAIKSIRDSKYKNENLMIGLVNDLVTARSACKPVVFKQKGKKFMIAQKRGHMEQRSNPTYANMMNQNCQQQMFQMNWRKHKKK